MSNRMVAVWLVDAGFPGLRDPERGKSELRQSSVPDNVREGWFNVRFGATLEWLDGKCHRKYTAMSASSW